MLRKVGPAALASALSLVTTFILAYQGEFEAWGINYIAAWSPAWIASHDVSGKVLLIELDTVSLQAIGAVITAAVAFFVTAGHHTSAAIKGAPQSGGQRATDE